MVRQLLACVAVSVACGSVLRAQREMPPPPPPIDILGVEPLDFEIVTGLPFTAEAVSEMTQELRDGNRIEQRSTTTIARDGRGRVRREQALPLLGPVMLDADVRVITISDPQERTVYVLDPRRRTVARSTLPAGPPRRRGEGPRGERPGGERPLPPPQTASEPLGARQIHGVRADGTRQTLTIPPGVFGNVGPINVVTERWESPELKMVLESRRSDPRLGDVVYRVVSLERGEPAADLFTVPSDYTVIERPPRPFGPPRR
jgi:hypothetical protein